MESLKELYKIGHGPSSSHTMGPFKAATIFAERYPEAERFRVTLYGSLAATGKGHMTDAVLRQTLAPVPSEIIFDFETDGKTVRSLLIVGHLFKRRFVER